MTLIAHKGGCHCGRVRFEVMAPAQFEVGDCKCSMCARTGYQHLMVPKTFTITGVRQIDGGNSEKHYPEGRGRY